MVTSVRRALECEEAVTAPAEHPTGFPSATKQIAEKAYRVRLFN